MRQFWDRKTVCLITGASQNVGKALAEDIAGRIGSGSLLILTSRSLQKLGVVRQSIYEINPTVQVQLLEWDLQNPDGAVYRQSLDEALKLIEADVDDYDLAMIVHNAGMAGDLTKRMIDIDDAVYLQQDLNVNVVSMIIANSVFWRYFMKCREKIIINFTSEMAKKPTPSFGVSSMNKACRYVALNVLCAENPEIKALHYDPGPVDTSLLKRAMATTHDPKVKAITGHVRLHAQLLLYPVT